MARSRAESIRVRISTVEKTLFFEVCDSKGMTPSRVIRQMMKEYVQQYKDKQGGLK